MKMTRVLSFVNRRLLTNLERCNKRRNKTDRVVLISALLNNNGTSLHSSSYSTSVQSKETKVDDPSLWVNSPIHVKTVVGLTLPELIRENRGDWGKAIAFECAETGLKYTHDQVFSQSRGFAAALMQAGFAKGDVIGVVLHNIPEYASVLLGIWEAGLVASPVNPSYTNAEIKRQLLTSESRAVVTVPKYLAAAREAKASNPNIKAIIVIGEPHEGCHTYHEMVKTNTSGVEFSKGSQIDTLNDTALLPYSSGTTGLPKGVMLTHSNMTTNMMQSLHPSLSLLKRFEHSNEQERFIGLLPFFHSYGLACVMIFTMMTGAHTMCFPKFETGLFVDGVRRHKPTYLHLVTPLISYIVNSADFTSKELAHIHGVSGGAAPIGQALINQLLNKAGKYFLFQEGYGMTELSPVSHMLPHTTNNQKVGSCGAPIPSTMTKIVDVATGKTLPRLERGEICVKGPQVMKGYFKNEEATRNTIHPEDGFLHTGDIGYYDNDNCLFIVDRLKELIKVKGFQVAPSELEDLLRSHDKVNDVAVIGVPDKEWGELPRAYIVRKKRANLNPDEIQDFMKEQVTAYKQLRGGIEFVDEIPKAPSGKILRRELLLAYKKERGIVDS